MQASQDGNGDDAAHGFLRARNGRLAVQPQVGAAVIVIAGVGPQEPPQMASVEDDEVVDALTLDRADQALDIAVLPGALGCDRPILNAEGADPAAKGQSVGAVIVANQDFRGAVPWESLGDLPGQPQCGRVVSDVGMQDRAAGVRLPTYASLARR